MQPRGSKGFLGVDGNADHLRRLAPLAKEYGASDRAGSRLPIDTKASGLLLLHDLRDLYVAAQRAEIT